jgi:uncharacterized membrane protein
MCALAYAILERRLVRLDGIGATLARAIGTDRKGRASLVLYASGIGLGLVHAWLGLAIYVIVAIVWFLPDRRIEHAVHGEQAGGG